MSSPAYHAPPSLAEAVALLSAQPDARVLAGGTDLIVQMRAGARQPGAIVDLKRIAGLEGIRAHDGGFAIGAATPCTVLKDHAALSAAWPGVVEAANLIGSVQVRGRATMAGNLCNASPAADSVPALVAAGALALIAGPQGERLVPVEQVPTGPGKTSLAAGEFIAELRLPARPERSSDAYLRITPRTEMDIAVAGAAVSLTLDADGTCTHARVALGAVAPTVRLVADAGAALIGSRFDETAFERMAEAVRAACDSISDKRGTADYRTAMAAVLARRAATIAAARAGGKA